MTLTQSLQVAQILISVLTLGGVAFAMGRLVGRIDSFEKSLESLKKALFGNTGYDGAFVSRIEMAGAIAEAQTKTRHDIRNEWHEEFGKFCSEWDDQLEELRKKP